MSSYSLKRRLLIGGAIVVALLIGVGAWIASSAWSDVNRVSIDRPEPEDDSGGPVAQEDDSDPESEDDDDDPGIQIPDDPGRQIILLVGSDTREELEDTEGFGEFEGDRADVVMVLIRDGSKAGLLSLPRDLLVENPCGGSDDRISSMLEGCVGWNGPTMLTVAVEDTIGQSVDHFVLIEFEGFQHAVDSLGGYEICVENPVRDERANLELPEGCSLADGEQTLAWMRSRRTQELTENGWRTMPGVNDLARNERQREFLIDMMGRMSDFTSPNAMAGAAQSLAPFVTVDSQLSLMNAAGLAWAMRGISSGSVDELTVPVYDATTADGASVLMASEPVDEIVADFLATTAAGDDVVLGISS
jgi:LCP family protein required for cell wall assembly